MAYSMAAEHAPDVKNPMVGTSNFANTSAVQLIITSTITQAGCLDTGFSDRVEMRFSRLCAIWLSCLWGGRSGSGPGCCCKGGGEEGNSAISRSGYW
jgi:hypothetical protein